MKIYWVLWFFVFSVFSAGSAEAKLDSITIRSSDTIVVNKWLYEAKPKITDRGVSFDLYQAKKNEMEKAFEACYRFAKKSEARAKSIERWTILQRLQCSIQNYRSTRKGVELIQESVFAAVSANLLSMQGVFGQRLRERWTEGALLLFDAQMRSRSKNSWQTFGAIEQNATLFSRFQRSEAYRIAGEIAFNEKRLEASTSFFSRSLNEDNREAVRTRALAVKNTYLKSIGQPEITVESVAPPSLWASEEELKIEARMQKSIGESDWAAAVDDGVRLLREFSGGTRATEAHKQILSVYLSLAAKKDDKFSNLKKRVLSQMAKVDGVRVYDWAAVLVSREYFEDAILLAESSLDQLGGQPLATTVILLAGSSALHSGQFGTAQSYYEKIIRSHSGSEASFEATFRVGLLHYRLERWAEATTYFEKFLLMRQTQSSYSEFDIPALYWLWRSQQQLKNPRADESARALIRRFPLSYYGLRARYELGEKKLSFDKKEISPKAKAEVFVTSHQKEAWQRFLILARGGWMSEAQVELDLLPTPITLEGRIIWAKLWASVFGYVKTFEILSSVWQDDPSYLSPTLLKIAYPKEFWGLVEAESKRTKLSPLVVLSLIRQESSFRVDVTSPANAMGLMQILPPTAKEIAQDMRLKAYVNAQDLFNPTTNVKIGTTYLARLMRIFNGHLPLALASYNAGMGNIRGWLQARSDLKDLSSQKSTQIQAEIWFDELPWSETSGYVKSILRNILIYQYLDQGAQELKEPFWQF